MSRCLPDIRFVFCLRSFRNKITHRSFITEEQLYYIKITDRSSFAIKTAFLLCMDTYLCFPQANYKHNNLRKPSTLHPIPCTMSSTSYSNYRRDLRWQSIAIQTNIYHVSPTPCQSGRGV